LLVMMVRVIRVAVLLGQAATAIVVDVMTSLLLLLAVGLLVELFEFIIKLYVFGTKRFPTIVGLLEILLLVLVVLMLDCFAVVDDIPPVTTATGEEVGALGVVVVDVVVDVVVA
jgi:hypothetical protein